MKAFFSSFLILFFAVACSKSFLEGSFPTDEKHSLKSLQLFGGSQEDIAHAIIATQDGGFAVLGNTKSNDGDLEAKRTNVSDLLLIKFNAAANVEWYRTYGGSKDDRGHSLVQLADGGFAFLGYSMSQDGDASINQGQHDNWVIRVDAMGQIVWEKSFGFAGHDHAYNIITTSDGGLFFNGFLDVTASNGEGQDGKQYSKSSRHGVGEFWCHKLDINGNLQWRRYFGGTSNDPLPDGYVHAHCMKVVYIQHILQ